jgi:hypothetical protein
MNKTDLRKRLEYIAERYATDSDTDYFDYIAYKHFLAGMAEAIGLIESQEGFGVALREMSNELAARDSK